MELALISQDLSIPESKVESVEIARRLVIVDNSKSADFSYQIGDVGLTYVPETRLQKTVESLKHVDAILVKEESVSEDLGSVKFLAKSLAIPVFLFTNKNDDRAKNLAAQLKLDAVHGGAFTDAFFKKVEFLKKIKKYRKDGGLKSQEAPRISNWTLKRAFDICVSFSALLFLSPIMLLVALIIKLESRGPVFYISKRAGTGYRIFNFYKFRSMRVGADKELAKLAHMNQYSENENNASGSAVFFKFKDDPRVTRFGSFLRKTSIDEIPQLINVLIGDMSLVGNRPLPLYEADKLTKDQIAYRFLAPAGITGLWQIKKRGKDNMSPEERIALDIEYAVTNTFWKDMQILFSTIPALLQKENV